MGCSQSKIENEEAVARCKARKQFMKDSLSARNAFAASHSSYAMNLKNTGAALADFVHAEIPSHLHHPSSSASTAAPSSSSPPIVSPPSLSPVNLPPPPPPLNFDPSPLQRAKSMPEMKTAEPKVRPAGPAIIEEDEAAEGEILDGERLVRRRRGSSRRGSGSGSSRGGSESGPPRQQLRRWEEETASRAPPPAPVPEHAVQDGSAFEYFFPTMETMPGTTLVEPVEVAQAEEYRNSRAEEKRIEEEEDEGKEEELEEEVVVAEEKRKKAEKAVAVEVPVQVVPVVQEKKGLSKRPGKTLNLVRLFEDLDDHFLRASQSAHEVSKMLEATRLHYHSNFADNRGHIDHSARVMRVITWNRSIKGMPNVDDGKDDFDSEEHETHATVLDKLLAWEKKLYDEVKVGEQMKYDYQKKVAMLNKQKKKGANSESLEKLKATVSLLHTRYIVDMQSMDSTVSEINRLRDEQLYPKLVQLVGGMAAMWKTMQHHHEEQFKIANELRHLGDIESPVQTTDHHHQRTCQLFVVVDDWHSDFCNLIDNQRNYIKALHNWLKQNLIPIESSLKEKVSSPPRNQNPPIVGLVASWDEFMEKLNDEGARSAIKSFAAVIRSISQLQEEEMKMRDKYEEVGKELDRKTRQFKDWYDKYYQPRMSDELDPERTEDNNPHKDALAERQFVVDALKDRLKAEEAAYREQSGRVRKKSLDSLRTRLPELFVAMSDISVTLSVMYSKLRSMSQDRNLS